MAVQVFHAHTRLRPRRHALLGAVAVGAVLALVAVPAAADPVPGATYNGAAADGAAVRFTISPDGTLVDSYKITRAHGQNCEFVAEGDKGVWEGAPIVNNSFRYQLGDAIFFNGTFPGAQSASGTFRFYTHAINSTPACDTGTVSWTATTTATPPPRSGSGSSGTGGTGGTGHTRTFATRVSLRKVSQRKLSGRISSSNRACRAGRTVILWRGSRRFVRTKSKRNGSFSFARTAKVRRRRVRASVLAMRLRTGTCVAGSSTFIKA